MANELLAQLNQARLEDDLTWTELGNAVGVDGTVLLRLVQSSTRTPHDRTVFKIQRFLDQRAKRAPKRRVSA
jgi:hypothetical protein